MGSAAATSFLGQRRWIFILEYSTSQILQPETWEKRYLNFRPYPLFKTIKNTYFFGLVHFLDTFEFEKWTRPKKYRFLMILKSSKIHIFRTMTRIKS